jgi:hypothetical protein
MTIIRFIYLNTIVKILKWYFSKSLFDMTLFCHILCLIAYILSIYQMSKLLHNLTIFLLSLYILKSIKKAPYGIMGIYFANLANSINTINEIYVCINILLFYLLFHIQVNKLNITYINSISHSFITL